MRLKLVK